jgi:hypothetical protein
MTNADKSIAAQNVNFVILIDPTKIRRIAAFEFSPAFQRRGSFNKTNCVAVATTDDPNSSVANATAKQY